MPARTSQQGEGKAIALLLEHALLYAGASYMREHSHFQMLPAVWRNISKPYEFADCLFHHLLDL